MLGLSQKEEEMMELAHGNFKIDVLKKILGFIDLTTLNPTDTRLKVENMCKKVNEFEQNFPGIPNVAAICVYPNFVSTVKNNLRAKNIAIASVAAGFPSSQTFLDVKNLESKMAVEHGATEIDIVISLGEFLAGNFKFVSEEIASIKRTIGKTHLKVILETGIIADPFKIWEASLLAMHSGADFIKTSTGKMQPAATIDAAIVMVDAIKQYHKQTGKKVGLKPAGGISTSQDALVFYTVVENVLGGEWLNSELFRIGASSLANKLLKDIKKLESGINEELVYF